MGNTYDFAGWATKVNLLCSDGRVIRKDAFAECDGVKVPLVWNHSHNRPEEVLGHALLENREEGVYAYCSFNDSDSAQHAKLLVQHGDINQLSIYANKLKHQGCNVIHGIIREVSLVLAGANPGAYIESVMMHGDDTSEEGSIYTGEDFDYVAPLTHAEKTEKSDDSKKGEEKVAEETKKPESNEEKEETVADVLATLNEKQKKAVYVVIGQAIEDASEKEVKHANESEEEIEHSDEQQEEAESEEEIEHSDDKQEEKEDDSDETVADVFNTFTEKQKKVVYALIGQALEDEGDDTEDDNEGGKPDMKHNVFENETNNMEVLSHSEMGEIFADAKRNGSLKEAVLAHGIEDIEVLFPDAKALTNEPEFVKREDGWVTKVLGGVHHSPFSRVKTIFADITAEQARAKGYQKGNLKIEEVFKLLKRVTNPTTFYKKQKLDRDDVLDITDFSVLPWLKREMRMMLDEELARAILIGDGRNPVDDADEKIDEECIRPIWKMEDLFTVKVAVAVAANATAEDKAKAFIKAAIKSRKNYQGSGNPTMFMSEDMLTDCLLIEDGMGRVIYDSVAKLAATLRVKEIVAVPVMEGQTRTDKDSNTFELAAIYVNLQDYNVGTDKGGEVNFFDDFDLDYNKMIYLMESRCSGTLVKPHSAVAIEFTKEA